MGVPYPELRSARPQTANKHNDRSHHDEGGSHRQRHFPRSKWLRVQRPKMDTRVGGIRLWSQLASAWVVQTYPAISGVHLGHRHGVGLARRVFALQKYQRETSSSSIGAWSSQPVRVGMSARFTPLTVDRFVRELQRQRRSFITSHGSWAATTSAT